MCRKSDSREFHTVRPATENVRSPNFVKVGGTVLLHFARVVDEAKCILVTRVCVSVPRRIPTLLHGPGCTLGNGRGYP